VTRTSLGREALAPQALPRSRCSRGEPIAQLSQSVTIRDLFVPNPPIEVVTARLDRAPTIIIEVDRRLFVQ
jgi:hypothetical protein